MADPKSHVGAVVLAGSMVLEPAPLEGFEVRVPAIRRRVESSPPPLNLSVIPFRYRVHGEHVLAIRAICGHRRHHRVFDR